MVRIDQGDLAVGRGLHLRLHHLQRLHLRLQHRHLVPQPLGSCSRSRGLLAICSVQVHKVVSDVAFDVPDPPFQLHRREVLVARVDRLELAAVDRGDAMVQEPEIAAQHDGSGARGGDRRTTVPPEVGDRLEVRRKPLRGKRCSQAT